MARGKAPPGAVDLVAVILVARLRPGPKLVFRYPPDLDTKPHVKNTSQSDSDSDDPAEHVSKFTISRPLKGGSVMAYDTTNGIDTHIDKQAHLDTIFGYTEDTLQKLLSPGCWADRKKFEMCLDGLTFVSHPVWAAQDGSWSKKHIHEEEKFKRPSTPPAKPLVKSPKSEARTETGTTAVNVITPPKPVTDFTHAPESFDSKPAAQSFSTSIGSESNVSAAVIAEQLMMFNVVFVLNSSRKDDHQKQVLDVYQHVAKALSKALHYCQKQTRYLGLESKKLLDMKIKGRQDGVSDLTLSKILVESSGLAWALKEVYERISKGEVAKIRLSGTEMSLQIPWNDSSDVCDESPLEAHAGLLLLEDKETLLAEVGRPDAGALAYLISEHTPTKSLQKLAIRLDVNLADIFRFARHLIKWRKARVITPLHPRNTYIIASDAPLDQLQSHYIPDYAKRFPVMPFLPQILKILSGKPVRWGMLIPSRDHRTPYMEILAYLVQHRIVEQLKTFGWLQAPTTSTTRAHQAEDEEVNQNKRPLSVASLLSPQMRPVNDDDATSVSSERTAIPLDGSRKRLSDGITSFPRRETMIKGQSVDSPQLVKYPYDASDEDRKRLQHIRDTIKDTELRDRFHALLRYFDGTYPFEKIAAAEGLKRAKVEGWLEWLLKEEFLVTFRAT